MAPCACGVQDCKTRRLRREQSRWLCRSHGTLQNAAARATWRRGLQESLHHIAQHGRRETVWCNTAVAQHREADQTPAPLQVIFARLSVKICVAFVYWFDWACMKPRGTCDGRVFRNGPSGPPRTTHTRTAPQCHTNDNAKVTCTPSLEEAGGKAMGKAGWAEGRDGSWMFLSGLKTAWIVYRSPLYLAFSR